MTPDRLHMSEPISRRAFLKGAGILGVAWAGGTLLQACSDSSRIPIPTSVPNGELQLTPRPETLGAFVSAEVLDEREILSLPQGADANFSIGSLIAGIKSKADNRIYDKFTPWGILVKTTNLGPETGARVSQGDEEQSGLFLLINGKDTETGASALWMEMQDDRGTSWARLLKPGDLKRADGSLNAALFQTTDRNTGAVLAKPLPILTIEYPLKDLPGLSNGQVSNLQIYFTPFGDNPDSETDKKIRISGVKLVSFISNVTPAPVATATSQPESTDEPAEPTATEEPTKEPTTEAPKFNIEGTTCLKADNCFGGLAEVNSTEGQKYYKEILSSFLVIERNAEYFKTNFNISDPKSPEALNLFLEGLRSNGYIMPAGLYLPLENYSATGVLVEEQSSFAMDTIIMEAYKPDQYTAKRLNGEIKNADIHSFAEGVSIFGLKLTQTSADGQLPKLSLLIASSTSDFPEGMKNIDPANAGSIDIANQWLMFFPHLFRNTDNARDFRGKKLMDLFDFFTNNHEVFKINGSYNRNSKPSIKPLQFTNASN